MRGLIHRDRDSSVIRLLLYLQAATAGSKYKLVGFARSALQKLKLKKIPTIQIRWMFVVQMVIEKNKFGNITK